MRICYGRPRWVPVTREQFIAAVIRNREKEVEKPRTDMRTFEQERRTELAGREEWIRELRKVYEQTEEDPAKREKLLEVAIKLAAATDAGMAKAAEEVPRRLGEVERLLLGRLREEFECSPHRNAHPQRGTWHPRMGPPDWRLPGPRTPVRW